MDPASMVAFIRASHKGHEGPQQNSLLATRVVGLAVDVVCPTGKKHKFDRNGNEGVFPAAFVASIPLCGTSRTDKCALGVWGTRLWRSDFYASDFRLPHRWANTDHNSLLKQSKHDCLVPPGGWRSASELGICAVVDPHTLPSRATLGPPTKKNPV